MMNWKNPRATPRRALTIARSVFVSSILVGLLAATNATAIPLGSWNQQSDDGDWTFGGSIISRVFDGHSIIGQTSESNEGTSNDGLFGGGHHVGGIDLSVFLQSARDWLTAHVQELPDYEGPRDGSHGSTPVPEPAAALLFAVGVGLVATRRRL